MANHAFFSILSRMKYINRWGLMRSTRNETLSEHSMDVAVIAHALAVIGTQRFGRLFSAERIALLALYHDCSEILTGDLPTPVKYYNGEITQAYKDVEKSAKGRLLSLLPEDLLPHYQPLVMSECSEEEGCIIKAADKISALMKCLEERSMGNTEFFVAEAGLRSTIDSMDMPEVQCFMEEFLPSLMLTLDEVE